MTLRIPPLSRRWRHAVLATLLLGAAACAPRPVERPREGAPPIVGGTPVRLENLAPPTLAPAANLVATATPTAEPPAPPSPSPLPVAASPAASPGLYPIISGLQPAPGASLPPGDVVIGARVTGSSDLVDIVAYLDGEPITIDVGGPEVRVKTISLVRTLAAGTHEVRIQARDAHGQLGGYRWQFTVGAGRSAPAAPTARPTAASPTRTPVPVPTRRPTATSARPAEPTAAPTGVPVR